MFRTLRSLIGRSQRPDPQDAVPETQDMPRPEVATYVVGDIHGRADLLELMLELIDAHIGGTGSVDPHLVFVGNYIDHGPDSATVLARMQELTETFPDNVACLMGSHERMVLDFLADPALRGPRWLRGGGDATLRSLGVELGDLSPSASPSLFKETAARLANALGTATQRWLSERPLSWSSGNLWVVHAGADPLRPMTEQSSRVLLWGHPEFDTTPRGDALWVAHGHVAVDRPSVAAGRVAVDTGAWSTGRLTACAMRSGGGYDFLQT
jgi:serine/threonine protein phosphatase 1